MIASDSAPGKFGIMTRLFRLIDSMPRDQQLTLLKQLVGDKVSGYLYKLIVEMTEEQQITLFDEISQSPQTELPVKTVSLEETEASMRKKVRKPCLLKASYRIEDRNYRDYILDISTGGFFIDTDTPFPVGRELLIKFSLPNYPQPIRLVGTIVWSTAKGFGAKFENVGGLPSEMLKSFVEQKE
jgi:Tfp pilus assembly protein PilZ